jgi:hypothetical protein
MEPGLIKSEGVLHLRLLQAPYIFVKEVLGDISSHSLLTRLVSVATLLWRYIPRAEDFPVMPAELIKVSLKPVYFFS